MLWNCIVAGHGRYGSALEGYEDFGTTQQEDVKKTSQNATITVCKDVLYVTGSEKRDHFALFHRFFNFWQFSRYHISATINKNGMMFGTVQVLTFS